jgi:hypothetical protein
MDISNRGCIHQTKKWLIRTFILIGIFKASGLSTYVNSRGSWLSFTLENILELIEIAILKEYIMPIELKLAVINAAPHAPSYSRQ